jgi:hypothetical protein
MYVIYIIYMLYIYYVYRCYKANTCVKTGAENCDNSPVNERVVKSVLCSNECIV